MSDFLLELRSQEIPARMQDRAREDLARLFADAIGKAGLAAAAIETFAGPRRLALIARGLPEATEAVREETKGPRASAPPQALEGFLRKTGLTREQLVERDGVLFAIVERPGRATADVLAEAIPAIVRGFPWPKSMRWGAASAETTSLRWVRPLQGIVALLGEAVVPFAIEGIESGAATLGHRFHHPGPITIGSADDYVEKLRLCHVIVDQAERRAIVADGAAAAAATEGLTLVPDEGLVAENAGLTEWPVPLLGRFDPAFLEVPREVIQLTMRTNQKYFACVDSEGALAPAFVCTANIAAEDNGAAIVAGNRKVLAARLADARFFWEQDLKVSLEDQAKKLGQIVFHEKLGTVADKVERVAKLAEWLASEGIVLGADPALARQAALLCKADLVTGMVGEFPELQGIMGGYYARAEGLPDQVADAIRDHYKPVGQGDEVPTAPVTVAVSLADKLDTLVAFFVADLPPTGSKDPFALRRAALGCISLLESNCVKLSLVDAVSHAFIGLRRIVDDLWDEHPHQISPTQKKALLEGMLNASAYLIEHLSSWSMQEALRQNVFVPRLGALIDFFADRLKVQQREAGIRHDLIDAVFALGGEDDLVRLLARVRALQAFVGTEDGANLLAGYKRAANILRKEGYDADEPTRHPGPVPGSTGQQAPAPEDGWTPAQGRGDESGIAPAEAALVAALEQAEPAAEQAVADERFEDAMVALAGLRAPIDAFFDQVIVNGPDPAVRAHRLALLARVRDAVHRVADFSRIEG